MRSEGACVAANTLFIAVTVLQKVNADDQLSKYEHDTVISISSNLEKTKPKR